MSSWTWRQIYNDVKPGDIYCYAVIEEFKDGGIVRRLIAMSQLKPRDMVLGKNLSYEDAHKMAFSG